MPEIAQSWFSVRITHLFWTWGQYLLSNKWSLKLEMLGWNKCNLFIASFSQKLESGVTDNTLLRAIFLNNTHIDLHLQHGIYKLCLSPNEDTLLTLHQNGRLAIWQMPSLKLTKTWSVSEQVWLDFFSFYLKTTGQLPGREWQTFSNFLDHLDAPV